MAFLIHPYRAGRAVADEAIAKIFIISSHTARGTYNCEGAGTLDRHANGCK
jgi:hypothetical protein